MNKTNKTAVTRMNLKLGSYAASSITTLETLRSFSTRPLTLPSEPSGHFGVAVFGGVACSATAVAAATCSCTVLGLETGAASLVAGEAAAATEIAVEAGDADESKLPAVLEHANRFIAMMTGLIR